MKIRIKFHLLLLQLCEFLINQRKHEVTWKNRHCWYVWLWNYKFCFLKIHTLWIAFKIIINWLAQCLKNINVNVTCPTQPSIFVPRVELNPSGSVWDLFCGARCWKAQSHMKEVPQSQRATVVARLV